MLHPQWCGHPGKKKLVPCLLWVVQSVTKQYSAEHCKTSIHNVTFPCEQLHTLVTCCSSLPLKRDIFCRKMSVKIWWHINEQHEPWQAAWTVTMQRMMGLAWYCCWRMCFLSVCVCSCVELAKYLTNQWIHFKGLLESNQSINIPVHS